MYEPPKENIKDCVAVQSRLQQVPEDLKDIANFVIEYSCWNLHEEEWNHPVAEVPLFRVLDALIQRGKPYQCASEECHKEILNLDDAINHCLEIAAKSNNKACASDHLKLTEWLIELKLRRTSFMQSFPQPYATYTAPDTYIQPYTIS